MIRSSDVLILIWRFPAFAVILLTLVFFCSSLVKAQPPEQIAGLTIENLQVYVDGFDSGCRPIKSKRQKQFQNLLKRLDSLVVMPTIRIVFQQETKPFAYECALRELKNRRYQIMGMFLDSYALARYRIKQKPIDPDYDSNETPTDKKASASLRLHDYKKRIDSYLSAFYDEVDIWEVGNEVNGEWADENCNRPSENEGCLNKQSTPTSFAATIAKINYAIEQVVLKNAEKSQQKKIALTLVYQPNCFEWTNHKMFDWFENAKKELRLTEVDYLLVSYYEDKNCDKNGRNTICNKQFFADNKDLLERSFCREAAGTTTKDDQELRQIYWNGFFKHLQTQVVSQNTKLGFGEVGCRKEKCADQIDLLSRYYNIKINQPRFVGGYFWWTAQPDISESEKFYSALQNQFRKF